MKNIENKKEAIIVDKTIIPFSFDKIKISLPFSEIYRNNEYKNQLLKMLKNENKSILSDVINLQDDTPVIIFGPRMEDITKEDVPPFYVTLKIHDLLLHNTMIDSGASHNLMPKEIMDNSGMDITRCYKDLFSFDSRKVRCLGLIKDLVVSLHQILEKSIVMDIVVTDVPTKFGRLLSRSWATKLKGTMQMDMSYATIPVFGIQRRLYRENGLKYLISSKECPENHPVYVVDTEMGSEIFFNQSPAKNEDHVIISEIKQNIEEIKNEVDIDMDVKEKWWTMNFDGDVSREGATARVDIIAPYCIKQNLFSYKFYFECTNNIAKYEAQILGLKIMKELQAKRVHIYGDLDLVIKQLTGTYQAKHPRMRAYRNLVLDLLESFKEFQLLVIPRNQNYIFDALAIVPSVFKIPIYPNRAYQIEVKHRPSVPDNVKYWQVFEDDSHINKFLTLLDEFENLPIDEDEEKEK